MCALDSNDERVSPDGPSDPQEEPTHDPINSLIRQAESETSKQPGKFRIDRRKLLAAGTTTGLTAAAVGLTVTSGLAQEGTPVADQATPSAGTPTHDHEAGPPTNEGFAFFVPYQAAIIQAAAARLIPTDENGPGATEAGVVYFIDHQLARQGMGYRGRRYELGPYFPGEPTQGDQSAMTTRDQFRVGIFALDSYAQQTFGTGFVNCTPEQQDQLLTDLQEGRPENFGGIAMQAQPLPQDPQQTPNIAMDITEFRSVGAEAFFTLLWNWTVAGFFCDPVQGGNRDMVGWKLIGFPGAHISYYAEIENYNQPFEGDYISLGQYQEQVSGGQ